MLKVPKPAPREPEEDFVAQPDRHMMQLLSEEQISEAALTQTKLYSAPLVDFDMYLNLAVNRSERIQDKNEITRSSDWLITRMVHPCSNIYYHRNHL